MGTRIETWGILGRFIPSATKDLIWKSLKKGSWYYNQLVEAERGKRARYQSERTRLAPEIAPQLAQLEEFDELSKEDKALLRTLRKQMQKCDELILISRGLDEQNEERRKSLMGELYWGQ